MSFAALFPGQGSQQVGMGKFLYENFKSTQQLFEEASDLLHTDFKKLCFEGPETDLMLTHNTQPCLVLVSTATHRAVKEATDLNFSVAMGHSVGEYSALIAAGVLSFAEAIKAVRVRGEAMQSAVPVGQGSMAAVMGLSDDQVRQLCEWVEKQSGFKPLSPANFNAPGQVVVSGSAKAVDYLKNNTPTDLFSEPKPRIKVIPLQVSAPFHCAMMKPAEEKMALVLNDTKFNDADFPVIQNFNAQPVTTAYDLRKNLISQVSAPVRWVESAQALKAIGISRCVEMGHGKVISGLMKKIDSEYFTTFNINSIDDLKALESLKA